MKYKSSSLNLGRHLLMTSRHNDSGSEHEPSVISSHLTSSDTCSNITVIAAVASQQIGVPYINRQTGHKQVLSRPKYIKKERMSFTHFGVELAPFDVVWIGAMQGLGIGLVFVPIASVAYATLPPAQRTEAASLFSLVRNLGSSIGISVLMSLLARGTQVSHAEIGARIPAYGAEQALLPAAWDPSTLAGAAALNAEVSRQAAVIAYVNDFWLLMLLTFLALPLVYFLRVRTGVASVPIAVAEH